ncbi:tyrosine-type recombinase/integrase [bacterium]|jgi:site-specific recombinase XerD|nr:tyrosine-type recombinase/integrase [bacterium]
MNNKYLLQSYIEFLSSQEFSESTKVVYRSRIKKYLAFLKELGILLEPGQQIEHNQIHLMHSYASHLAQSGRSCTSSITATLSTVQHFLTFVGVQVAETRRTGLVDCQTRTLTDDEWQRFIHASEKQTSSRNRSIGCLFAFTGITAIECASLNIENLNLVDAILTITKINGRRSSIPLNDFTYKCLLQWLGLRKLIEVDSGQALFVNRWGERVKPTTIGGIVKNIGLEAGLDLSPMILQQTVASRLMRGGVDCRIVQDIIGVNPYAQASMSNIATVF